TGGELPDRRNAFWTSSRLGTLSWRLFWRRKIGRFAHRAGRQFLARGPEGPRPPGVIAEEENIIAGVAGELQKLVRPGRRPAVPDDGVVDPVHDDCRRWGTVAGTAAERVQFQALNIFQVERAAPAGRRRLAPFHFEISQFEILNVLELECRTGCVVGRIRIC